MSDKTTRIRDFVRTVLAPLVIADGGELYLLEANERVVSLHLAGRFSGCPGNTLVTRRVVEPAVHAIAPQARVQITSGILVPKGAERLGG